MAGLGAQYARPRAECDDGTAGAAASRRSGAGSAPGRLDGDNGDTGGPPATAGEGRGTAGGSTAPGGGCPACRAVALAGKAVRGTYAPGAPLHLVSLVTHERVQVLGQVAVGDKRNEIPAGRRLLRERDWHGWVVTLDALHTQRETAELIRAHAGGGTI